MSYNSAIPNAGDPRASSQRQLLANFQAINSVWSVNHASLNGTDIQGQHDVLTIRPQSADPVTAANQVALYGKLVSTIPNLFFRPASSGTPIQLTYGSVSAGSGDTQQSFIAGPFVIYMGIVRGGITSGQTITVLPSSTLIYANISTFGGTAPGTITVTAIATNISGNTFQVFFQNGITVPIIYYFAVGK